MPNYAHISTVDLKAHFVPFDSCKWPVLSASSATDTGTSVAFFSHRSLSRSSWTAMSLLEWSGLVCARLARDGTAEKAEKGSIIHCSSLYNTERGRERERKTEREREREIYIYYNYNSIYSIIWLYNKWPTMQMQLFTQTQSSLVVAYTAAKKPQ